jgi:hypothetical protein
MKAAFAETHPAWSAPNAMPTPDTGGEQHPGDEAERERLPI